MLKNQEQKKKTDVKIQQLRREEEEQRAKDLASKLGFPYIDLRISPIDDSGLLMVPEQESRNAKAAIIQKKIKELYIAVLDPRLEESKKFIEDLQKRGYSTNILITSESNLEKTWQRYQGKTKKAEITKTTEIDIAELKQIQQEIETIKDLKEKLSQADLNATQLLNIIMAAALKLEASDIHLENEEEDTVRLRFRMDGILQDVTDIPDDLYQLLLSRIKILSSLKLNVHNTPQDGRFSFQSAYSPEPGSALREGTATARGTRPFREIENRVSVIPAEYGENIVIRILDPKTISLNLEELGIQDYDFKTIENELKKPNGMIITTGPTGSGKTTLLYAFLKRVNDPGSKIITLEDPIEYHLEGIEQTQVEAEKGYTFAAGLRSILRQDPDIILVGEVRDNETAETAINAALTGHLVFSTIHTNDAAGAIPRLVDMKVNPSLIPPALNLVIAQRLVRRICPKCSKNIKPDAETIEKIKNGLATLPSRVKKPKLEGIKIKQANPQGCAYCNFTGYKGRIGVFELFIIDDPMEKTILKTPSVAEIKETASRAGMVTMKQDGLLKVLVGTTTLYEAERVLGE